MKANKLFLLILAVFLIFSLTSCGEQGGQNDSPEEISLVLEWEPNTNHTGIYVAQANGYYADEGLAAVILTPPEGGAAGLVASGKAQFGIDVQESLAIELTLDEPMPIVAVASIISHNNSGIISLKESGIDDFKKLEGKVYASWDSPTELRILKQTMEDAGGDFSKLKTGNAPATDAVSMIKSKLFDAVWVYENWDVIAADVAGVDYNFIKFADASPVLDFYTPVIIANTNFLAENQDAAKKFMRATAKGYEYAIKHPEEAAQILLDAVPELSPDLIFASQSYLAGTYAGEGENWGIIDEARWSAFYDWMYAQGIIPVQLGSQGFTNEFLP